MLAVCPSVKQAEYPNAKILLFRIISASMLDEAKRWFEASTVICRFVPGGSERAERVNANFYRKRSMIQLDLCLRFLKHTCIFFHVMHQTDPTDDWITAEVQHANLFTLHFHKLYVVCQHISFLPGVCGIFKLRLTVDCDGHSLSGCSRISSPLSLLSPEGCMMYRNVFLIPIDRVSLVSYHQP